MEKDFIIQEEFRQFRDLLSKRFQSMDKGIQLALMKATVSELTSMRLGYFLTDVSKIMTSKELLDFGETHEVIKTYQEELKITQEMFELLIKIPDDVQKLIETDAEIQFKLLEIQIKRSELLLKRAKEKGFGTEIEQSYQNDINKLQEFRSTFYSKINITKEFEELKNIHDFPSSLEAISQYFEKNKEEFARRFQKLPNLPSDIHLELRISSLYGQIKALCWLGLGSSAIVLMGVLLEATLKEIIFFKEGKEFIDLVREENADFGQAIKYCREKDYITEKEGVMLGQFRDDIRNKYQHHNVNAIAKNYAIGGVKIDMKEGESPIKKMEEALAGLKSGEIKYEMYDQSELRSFADVLKVEVIDKRRAIPLFLQVHEFLIKKAKQFFASPSKQQEDSASGSI